MCPKTNRLLRYLISAFGLGAVIGLSSPSDAHIQQIVIDQTATVNFSPIMPGTSTPGPATSYTVYTGRVFGELKPNDPDNNSIITDIDLAPKSKGRVEYAANFQIVTPTDPTQRSGLMIHAVPNRGGSAFSTNALLQGATYVQSGWQGDLLSQCSPSPAIPYPCFDLNSGPYGSLDTTSGVFTPPQVPDVAGAGGVTTLANYVVQVPVAENKNGKQPITGKVYSHVCTGTNGCGLAVGSAPTSTAQLVIQGAGRFAPYQPASMDTNQAEFWTVSSQTFTGVTGPKTPIPSGQWAWAYCPNGWPTESQLDLSEKRHVQPEPAVRDGIHGEESVGAGGRSCRVSRPYVFPPLRGGCSRRGFKPNLRHGQQSKHRWLVAVGRIPPWLHLLGLQQGRKRPQGL